MYKSSYSSTLIGNKENADRRRFNRFLTEDNAFAAIGSQYTKVGRIQDICIGGLAFTYIVDDGPSEQPTFISIFLSGEKVFLSNIPCKIVYDTPLEEQHPLSSVLLRTRRCGVKFIEPEQEQVTQLKHFLENYTRGISE